MNFDCKGGKSLKVKENGRDLEKRKKPNLIPSFGHIARALHLTHNMAMIQPSFTSSMPFIKDIIF